jgi:hypothetical protein
MISLLDRALPHQLAGDVEPIEVDQVARLGAEPDASQLARRRNQFYRDE